MARVTYIQPNGEPVAVDVPIGSNLMTAAGEHAVKGIIGECGGSMSCATCHVIVDPGFAALLPPPCDTENQMLDFTAAPRAANSRLACQITMRENLEGISVRIADSQV